MAESEDMNFLEDDYSEPTSTTTKWFYSRFKNNVVYDIVIYDYPKGIVEKIKNGGKYFVFKGEVYDPNQDEKIICNQIWFAVKSFKDAVAFCKDKQFIQKSDKDIFTRQPSNVLIKFKRGTKICNIFLMKSVTSF